MTLLPITPDFWEWDDPHHRVLGAQLGRRLCVVRLPDGTLWLHSPIRPIPEVVAAIAKLGRVAHIIGANTIHDCFLRDAQVAWPDATLHGAPGLARMSRRLDVQRTLGDEPDPAWAGVIDQHVMRGMPWLNEVVFFHRPSRTLIIADLAFNFGANRGFFTRLFFRLYGLQGKFKPSVLERLLIRDKDAFRESFEKILTWDFTRIAVGHGNDVEVDAKAALRAGYAFLYR